MTDPTELSPTGRLLARVRPARDQDTSDYPQAIRRVARDLQAYRRGEYELPPWWSHHTRARLGLHSLARSVLTEDALARVAALAEEFEFHELPAPLQHPIRVCDIDAEIEGYRVFGCLCYLTGHPNSAAFWWGIGAGAGDQFSAECIYLHHLQRGELRQAIWWYQEAYGSVDQRTGTGTMPPGVPDMLGYLRVLPAHLIPIPWQSAENTQPADNLAHEVERLVVRAGPTDPPILEGVAGRPGPELATRIEELASR